jgi:phosphoglycerate kinase
MKVVNQDIGYGKVVLLRCDFNVPMHDGKITDFSRIKAALPTIELLQEAKAKVVIISHLGRPSGEDLSLSLVPVYESLEHALFTKTSVFDPALRKEIAALQPGDVLLLENIRFYAGEELNDPDFAARLASLGDVYVNDAFSCSHRSHASITGIAKLLPSYAGLLLAAELENLSQVIDKDLTPAIAIVGGSKVSTKIGILKHLSKMVDVLVIGGAMANTFLVAKGIEVGKSLYEKQYVEFAEDILQTSKAKIILPIDVVVEGKVLEVSNIAKHECIYDIGPNSVIEIAQAIDRSKLVLWNGPVGKFEDRRFANSSLFLARKIAGKTAEGKIISIVGGGDTIAAINQAGLIDAMSYASYSGGAFLEWLEGSELPGITALSKV